MSGPKAGPPESGGELIGHDFTFQTLLVDEKGEVVERKEGTARQVVQDLGNGSGLEMVAVPAGSFWMGSRAGTGYPDETPQHTVRIPSFLIGKYPVTQKQWRAVMGSLPPCRSAGDRKPVDRVSWSDAVRFCRRLAERTGRPYRLLSEAEWEYACRAGTTTPFCCGPTITTDLANYVGEHTYRSEPKGVYRHGSTPVGSFPPNAFGVYDMHGNLWEWCADAWHDTYEGAPADGSPWEHGEAADRVLRGGCWHDTPDLCRSAARLKGKASEGEDYYGFRVAVRVEGEGQEAVKESRGLMERLVRRIRGQS